MSELDIFPAQKKTQIQALPQKNTQILIIMTLFFSRIENSVPESVSSVCPGLKCGQKSEVALRLYLVVLGIFFN